MSGQICLLEWSRDYYNPSHVAWHYLQDKENWFISKDFETYRAITRALEATIDYSPQPNLTSGFWIEHRIKGKMACIMAARKYILTCPLTEEIPRMMDGATCDAPSAPSIQGKVSFSGGLWVNPRHQGQGLGTKACKILHAVSLLYWAPEYFIAVTEKSLEKLTRAQGFRRIEPTIQWQHWDMNFCWMDDREAMRILGTPSSARS